MQTWMLLLAALVATLVLFGCTSPKLFIDPDDLRSRVENGAILVDARSPGEYHQGHIEGAINIPHTEVSAHTDSLPSDRDILVYCRSGHRSEITTKILAEKGFGNAINVGTFRGLMKAGLPDNRRDVPERE